jgi:hypothetical protein
MCISLPSRDKIINNASSSFGVHLLSLSSNLNLLAYTHSIETLILDIVINYDDKYDTCNFKVPSAVLSGTLAFRYMSGCVDGLVPPMLL